MKHAVQRHSERSSHAWDLVTALLSRGGLVGTCRKQTGLERYILKLVCCCYALLCNFQFIVTL